MSLDMFVYYTGETDRKKQVDFPFNLGNAKNLFAWQDHTKLHQWMENLYYEKGGVYTPFNLVTLPLDYLDLDKLKASIEGYELPVDATKHPIYAPLNSKGRINDLRFVGEARSWYMKGHTIIYSAWW